jgi:putative transposase
MRNQKWLRLPAYVGGLGESGVVARERVSGRGESYFESEEEASTETAVGNPERPPSPKSGSDWDAKYLVDVACVAKPDTILACCRKLVANNFDGSKRRQYPGRLTFPSEVEALVARMARENTGWGYDRIVGALANLGHHLSDQIVGNILSPSRDCPGTPAKSNHFVEGLYLGALRRSGGC